MRAGLDWLTKFKLKRMKEKPAVELSINLPYVVSTADRSVKNGIGETNVAITQFLIQSAVYAKHKEMKERATQRTWARIQNALTLATKAAAEDPEHGPKSIKIDNLGFELVRDAVREWATPSQFVGWFMTLVDEIETLDTQMKKNEPTEK